MKVLITGAAGFIGSNLAHQIYKKNWEMILIDNLSYGKEENLKFSDCDLRVNLLKWMFVIKRESKINSKRKI